MRNWVTRLVPALGFLPLSLLAPAQSPSGTQPSYFRPTHRLPGIGLERAEITEDLLATRTDLMIQSQTFAIMRDPQSIAGAERITSPKLQSLFRQASRQSGFPEPVLEAISYLESWGNPKAESPAGPRGIMQISEATARRMGLRVSRSTRYKVTRERVLVRRRGKKPVYRTVRHKTPYSVTVRDDRLVPDRAIPAAANYLARMEQHFGGRDWAIFAYHCGEGCVSDLMALASQAQGVRNRSLTVARMFFSCNPVHNRALYEAIQGQMERDYSPTYWFRVMRAEELLALYRSDPAAFRQLGDEYKSRIIAAQRAPNRLSVWLRSDEQAFRSWDDIRADQGRRLAKAFDEPGYFGYRLLLSGTEQIGGQAAPAAIGTLAYIAFETRRLYEALRPGATFEPIEVTALVQPLDLAGRPSPVALGHGSGQVFDVAYRKLPLAERECLKFILDDLGWEGYLSFTEESPGNGSMHIGCSPSSREFFTQVFQEALAARQPLPEPAIAGPRS